MSARVQRGHYLFYLEVTVTHCALLFLSAFLLLYSYFWHRLDDLLSQSFAHIADFLLQLQQLFIGHSVGVDIMLIFGLESHRQEQLIKILGFALVKVMCVFSSLFVFLSKSLQFFGHLFNGLEYFFFF